MNKTVFARWRGYFLTGLAVLLPAIITLAVIKWLFGTIASLTDSLLFFLPTNITHYNQGEGPMRWYWSLSAFVLAIAMVSCVGLLTRYYIGIQAIAWLDQAMRHVPLLNKIYSTIQQVNHALTTGKKSSFKTVVLVEFPREGSYSVGFITSERDEQVQRKTMEHLVGVFIPTTPNPTSGFLIFVPEDKVTKLDMSVAEGIKYIISLGSISPEYEAPPKAKTIESSSRKS